MWSICCTTTRDASPNTLVPFLRRGKGTEAFDLSGFPEEAIFCPMLKFIHATLPTLNFKNRVDSVQVDSLNYRMRNAQNTGISWDS